MGLDLPVLSALRFWTFTDHLPCGKIYRMETKKLLLALIFGIVLFWLLHGRSLSAHGPSLPPDPWIPCTPQCLQQDGSCGSCTPAPVPECTQSDPCQYSKHPIAPKKK